MSTPAEIARIIREEWKDGESAPSFLLRRLRHEKLVDVRAATEILIELDAADDRFNELFDWQKNL